MNDDEFFNFSGRIPTDADFWKTAESTFITEAGITTGFSKVMGEQVYRPINKPDLTFYNMFASGGSVIKSGVGWCERLVARTSAKRYNPKATAQDDLGFYDQHGKEQFYKVNVEGWRPTSLPSSFVSGEISLKPENVGTLNGLFVDNTLTGYQMDMNSAIAKKLVSTISHSDTVDVTDMTALREKIGDLADDMIGTTTYYNEFTDAENLDYRTNSEKVYAFLSNKLWRKLRESRASLPSPDELIENVTFVPLYDGCPTPVTTAELAAGRNPEGATVVGWDSEPVAKDQPKPEVMMCSSRRCEYRPYEGSYKINLSKNGASDYNNQHLLWKGSIAIRPEENAIRLNASA